MKSWRLLKKLASSDLIFEVETKLKNGEIHLCLTSDSLHYEIPVTYGFVNVMKERLIKMTDTNSTYPMTDTNSTYSMPAKKKTALNMNFDFGPINEGVAISPYGLAVLTADYRWLTYNPATAQTVDVTGFTFDFQKMIYKMPVAIKDLRAGDMVLHCSKPMYVQSVEEDGIHCIDILNSEVKVVVPVTNMFGFDFVTKIVSLMNFNAAQPSAENPFGNLMPLMMMSSVMGDDSDNDFSKMMMMSMMMGGSNPFTAMFAPQDK